jgi:hypothetical protein
MPLIQIEQDSPEVIENACDLIASMAAGMREEPGDVDNHYGRAMHVTGFLAALKHHELISHTAHDRLQHEVWQASQAVAAEEGAEG